MHCLLRHLVLFAITLALSLPVRAAEGELAALPVKAAAFASYTAGVMSQIDLALLAAEDVVQRENSELVVQTAALRRYVDRVPGMRAILYIDKSGQLLLDTFNYPPPKLDLGSRSYFEKANRRPKTLIVDAVVKGGTSSLPFVPIARQVANSKGPMGVATGVMNPGALMAPYDICGRCVVLIVNREGEVLASNPPASLVQGLTSQLVLTSRSGTGKGVIGGYEAQFAFQQAGEFDAFAVYAMVP